jgi:hypothetical protein
MDNYYLMSVYGNGNGATLTRPTYLEWYDLWMRKWKRKDGGTHRYKIHSAMKDKHANTRK